MFNSHLLHNWVSEWIFSTLVEAVGLEDQLLPGSPESCDDMTVAGSDGQALWVYQMFLRRVPPPRPLSKILLCSACPVLVDFLCSALTVGGGARREETESVWRCKSRNGGFEERIERQDARCKSPRRLLSISAIDRKMECELKEAHTALHLLFCGCIFIYSPGAAKRFISHAVHMFSHTHTFTTLKWTNSH